MTKFLLSLNLAVKESLVIALDEFSFIDTIKQSMYKQSSLLKGIGDDAAVIGSIEQELVISKDMFVENVHFAKHTMKSYDIGYKALAANLSDMAAMGAKPAYYLVAISIPNDWPISEVYSIFQGMRDLADKFEIDLIGGDTVSGKELVISITIIGYGQKDRIRYRSLAREGDIVFVTGTLGDSQAGLYILNTPGNYRDSSYFINRHQQPIPRVEFALELMRLSRFSLNDISDGIASEANEIAEASNVTLVLKEENIPVHLAFQQFDSELQYKWKLFGGEDFELIGTVPREDWGTVQSVADKMNVKVTPIGYVTQKQESGFVLLQNRQNTVQRLDKKGFNHLSR
jgi:thiamine-monophosphate kinase